jgi:Arabinose-binding domain of AraC transcription regulator, N-term
LYFSTPGLFDQPRILVTTEELFALWQAIGRASPNPAVGLDLGTESKSEHFDPVVVAALATGSFGEAMRQVGRYKQLSCPEELVLEADGIELSIRFRWLLANGAEPYVLTDVCFAWVLNIARHGTRTRMSPLRIELARPRAHARLLERHFGCPVIFGAAPMEAYRFQRALFHLPNRRVIRCTPVCCARTFQSASEPRRTSGRVKPACVRRKKWRPWAVWRAESRTTLTTC